MPTDATRHARNGLPQLRVAWFLIVAACLGLAGLGWLASPAEMTAPPAAGRPATLTLTALGVFCALATLGLDRLVLSPEQISTRLPIPDPDLLRRHLLAGHMALWSLAVLPALLGFALVLLGGPPRTHLALCALSLGVLARLMPTRRRIAQRFEAVLDRPLLPVGGCRFRDFERRR